MDNSFNIRSYLLNDLVVNSAIFRFISYFLKNQYYEINKKNKLKCYNKLNLDVSYDNFKMLVMELITLIMKSYLKDIKYEGDECLCQINKIGIYSGYFNYQNNLIVINENSIYKIYQGDIVELRVIFHELNHFKIKYDIMLGKNDTNIKRIIKEKLLSKNYLNYYMDNYEFESEEVFVDLLAGLDLLTFLGISKINIVKKDINKIKHIISENKEKYYYYKRKVESLKINDYFIDFRKAFDLLIENHPEWLNYSQIQDEYYKDSKGLVKKIRI